MILPSKHLSPDRALLTVGGGLLTHLDRPMTLSALWDAACQGTPQSRLGSQPLGFDRYVLALDLLFLIGAIEYSNGLLRRVST